MLRSIIRNLEAANNDLIVFRLT